MKKGVLLFVLAILISLASGGIAFANELTDDYYDIAANYYKSNNYAKSLEYLNLIISIDPCYEKAAKLKNKILPPEIDDSKTAKESCIAEAETPEKDVCNIAYDSDYYNGKGQEFYNKKDFKTAIEYFYKSITLNKRNARAYNNLAMAYWCQNNLDFAIKYFKKSNFLNKRYTQPLVNLANLYGQTGKIKKQIYYLKKAIKINRNDYLAYFWLGTYYKNTGNYPQAIKNYKEVIKVNPKFSQVYLNLAICFFETEQFNYTILAMRQYMEFFPDSDYAYFLMAKASLALGQYEQAKIYIQKAIEINNYNEYQYILARTEYAIEDYNEALAIFQNILKTSENAELFNYVGLCNYKLKNIKIAIINFRKAIELDGLRPIYYYNLAQSYKTIENKEKYVEYVNTATKISPANYQDYIDLSYIYYDNGNAVYAINSLNNAIRRYPKTKALYLAKMKIYQAIGDHLHYNETKDFIEMSFNR